MEQKVIPRSCAPGSPERGLSKCETSRGLKSGDVPKSCSIKEEIQKAIGEGLKRVKSDLKEVKKELKLLNLRLANLFGSCIPDIVKGKKVQLIHSLVKDDDNIQGEAREESEHSSSQSVQLVRSGKRQKKGVVRNWQLRLKNELSSPVFTEQKLTIEVELVDANTGDVVKFGPESSVKLEVVVVDSDYETVGCHNWTQEDFDKSVVRPREEKGPLLVGNVGNLNRGTGVLRNVRFTDNSSWTRSKTFRLAVRASPEYRENIREAISGPITVKAKRGQGKSMQMRNMMNLHLTMRSGD
ncbi:hypothetical protein BT93_L2107 [Corymbia citriodora subsp. variegata]|uniref:Calmodulin binding protein-like N-terminal domain-containing protein n=1 Tax=Corymbia citriodora subsp. variegata TaxID=360336 RepID=A0A8T0CKM8_CORYI|nr:hypothetical protein BT93_L2107 [Corymbia citriodora subsp. variegata]